MTEWACEMSTTVVVAGTRHHALVAMLVSKLVGTRFLVLQYRVICQQRFSQALGTVSARCRGLDRCKSMPAASGWPQAVQPRAVCVQCGRGCALAVHCRASARLMRRQPCIVTNKAGSPALLQAGTVHACIATVGFS
jgi:hypothetical protein